MDQLPSEPVYDQDYGTEAAEAAFVYRVTGERRYRERAVQLLAHSAALYVRRHAQKRAVNWYSFTRINAIAAFDWLFNELPVDRRKTIGRDLLAAVRDSQPTTKRGRFVGPTLLERENWAEADTGFTERRACSGSPGWPWPGRASTTDWLRNSSGAATNCNLPCCATAPRRPETTGKPRPRPSYTG